MNRCNNAGRKYVRQKSNSAALRVTGEAWDRPRLPGNYARIIAASLILDGWIIKLRLGDAVVPRKTCLKTRHVLPLGRHASAAEAIYCRRGTLILSYGTGVTCSVHSYVHVCCQYKLKMQEAILRLCRHVRLRSGSIIYAAASPIASCNDLAIQHPLCLCVRGCGFARLVLISLASLSAVF